MYCIANRCVLPPLSASHREQLLTQAGIQSLVSIFEAMPDPRKAHGLRYDLPFLLTCLVAALLCNCDSSEAVAQWCRDHQRLLREVFGSRLFLTPSGSLYRWLLPRLDAAALERVLGQWVQATTRAAADDPLALDGKTVRGARSGRAGRSSLVSVLHPSEPGNLLANPRRGKNERDPSCQAGTGPSPHRWARVYRRCPAYPRGVSSPHS